MCFNPDKIYLISRRMFEDYVSIYRDGVFPVVMGWNYRCSEKIVAAEEDSEHWEVTHLVAMKALRDAMNCKVFPILEVDGKRLYVESDYPDLLAENPYVQLFGVHVAEREYRDYELAPSEKERI